MIELDFHLASQTLLNLEAALAELSLFLHRYYITRIKKGHRHLHNNSYLSAKRRQLGSVNGSWPGHIKGQVPTMAGRSEGSSTPSFCAFSPPLATLLEDLGVELGFEANLFVRETVDSREETFRGWRRPRPRLSISTFLFLSLSFGTKSARSKFQKKIKVKQKGF